MDPAAGALVRAVVLAGGLALAGVARATPLPPAVAAMIDTAAATGDAATLKAVVDVAKKSNPASVAEIDAQVAALNEKAKKARLEKLAHQGLLEGIKGEGQIGFNASSGGTTTTNLSVGLKLSKESLRWKQTVALSADFEKENGVVSDEKYRAGYEIRYNISPQFYTLGTLFWDRDPFEGYSSRESGSIGLGYKLIDRPKMSLSLDAGPAGRRIVYVSDGAMPGYAQTEPAARVSSAFSWTVFRGTVFTENLIGFIQKGDNTFTSLTAITTKLEKSLSARLSFEMEYDSLLPPGYNEFETFTTRGDPGATVSDWSRARTGP